MKTIAPRTESLALQLTTGGKSLIGADPIDSMIAPDRRSAQLDSSVQVETAAVIGPTFTKAFRIDAASFSRDAAPENQRGLDVVTGEIKIPTVTDLQKGDVVLIRFWVRCVRSADGRGSCICQFQPVAYELDKPAEVRSLASAQWTRSAFPFVSNYTYRAGDAWLVFAIGFEQQTIEIGGIEALNYGSTCTLDQLAPTPVTYRGRSKNSSWRRAAQERIERIRKRDFAIRVVDCDGHPVPGVRVSGSLARHSFGFGSCVDLDHLLGTTQDCDTYRETFLTYFNRAVFENDMKWVATDQNISPRLDAGVKWLHDHEISIRGHNLVWPAWRWLPETLWELSDDRPALLRRTADHITQIATHFKGQLTDWDVVNEPYSCHELLDAVGGPGIMTEWFALARKADQNCRLCINDFGILDGGRSNRHRRHYLQTIRDLLQSGAPVGGIGIQSHFGHDLPSPDEVLAVLDEFAELNLPIHSTEFSIDCDDRELQADYLHDYATMLFSHPAVEELILWGFWSGRHWRPRSAMFGDDWSIRPIGLAWADLGRQWSTDIAETTGADGTVRFRGFFGSYDFSLAYGRHSIKQHAQLTKERAEDNSPVSIVLPNTLPT